MMDEFRNIGRDGAVIGMEFLTRVETRDDSETWLVTMTFATGATTTAARRRRMAREAFERLRERLAESFWAGCSCATAALFADLAPAGVEEGLLTAEDYRRVDAVVAGILQ